MSSPLLNNLEGKIDSALELIELQRMQIEELEEKNITLEDKNAAMQNELTALKSRQEEWEQSLVAILRKLDKADLSSIHLEGKENKVNTRMDHLEELEPA